MKDAATLAEAGREAWLEWAAHNLALNVGAREVGEELVRAGFDPGEAATLIERMKGDPVFRAAERLARSVRNWGALADALFELERQTFDFTRIERRAGLSGEDFHREYYALNRPVILTDVVPAWPAFEKWSLDFLRERHGEASVRYQHGRSEDDHRDCFRDHARIARFADYIDLVETGAETNAYYLIAHDKLLDRPEFRTLIDDIVFDPRYLEAADQPGRVFFWLGPKGSATSMHRDLGNVFFAQITGRKKVVLVPSKQMHKVYNERGYHSEADFDRLDLDAFPQLREATIIEEVIAPGELLFIPLGWWHFVKSLDVTITVTGNNFAFPNRFPDLF